MQSHGLQLTATVLAELAALIRCAAVGAEFGLGCFLYRCCRGDRDRLRAALAVFYGLLDLLADGSA